MARRRAWSFLVYDQYVMIDAAGNRHVYFDDDGMTVAQFKRRYGMVVTAGHNYQVDGIPLLPGELEKWKSWFIASDISLRAARSILKILEIVEAEGACLAPFDATDLRIYPTGDVKLKGDMVLENLDAVQLDERLRRGYVSAATVIEGFYGKRIPPDLEHLVKLMKTDFSARAIFPIHAGLVPIAAYPSVLKEIYDHARFVIPKAHMRTILSTLQAEIPKISDWQALARTNALLTIILDYKDYDVPPNYGQQIELNLLEAKALHELGLDQTPKQTSLTRLQIEQFRALKLFEFLRHRTSHRMDCYQKWMATPKKDASTAQGTNDASTAQGTEQVAPPMNDAFTAQGTERVARVRYPLVLPVVQLKLHKMGHLAALPIRDLF